MKRNNNRIMNRIMMSCKKATHTVEKQHLSGLSFWERLQLAMHLLFCRACRIYRKKSLMIDKVLEKMMWYPIKQEFQELDSETKKRMREKLRSRSSELM